MSKNSILSSVLPGPITREDAGRIVGLLELTGNPATKAGRPFPADALPVVPQCLITTFRGLRMLTVGQHDSALCITLG